MARTTTIINFSAPPSIARLIVQQAKKEGKTQSELLRDAFESYMFAKKLRKFQETGKIIAQKLELESYDDIEKYFG